MRGPALANRNRMVEVTTRCRAVTAGPAARQIAAPHKIGQRLRRHIARLGRSIAGVGQRHQFGRHGQFGDEFGGDEPVGAHFGCGDRATASDGGRLGDHVDHHRRCGGPRAGRTLAMPATTTQPIGPGGQRPQSVSAALVPAARVPRTYRVGEGIESLLQRMSVRGQQAPADQRDAALDLVDADLAIALLLRAPPQRIGVGVRNDLVDLRAQPAPTHRRPARQFDEQFAIHGGKHRRILDQIGAVGQCLKSQIVDLAGFEHLGHLREPLAHDAGIAQPAGRQALADPQRRSHFGGHRLHGVHRPILGF
ncbi:hypothetical protein LAUMK7_05661 [Mycobacterium kansasii]|nr:hypothetical protein MKANGN_54160 [Mycobacterium kansasii]VAZ63967.1 hypothetical protein LAUMK40_00075 [Mycobacterium kansasii]VAZ81055.1 hypothetical protein LAUMK7_05661 [Mycobacterium kansasii]